MENATLSVGLVMARCIRDFHERTGHRVGFKPAGGIRTAKQALEWMMMMMEELGTEYLRRERFRFGASSLLTDIERQLEHLRRTGATLAPGQSRPRVVLCPRRMWTVTPEAEVVEIAGG